MSSIETLLRNRYSCRKFLPTQVPRETIEKILEWAQLTPSWCNTQPWQVILLSGNETDRFRNSIYAYAKGGGHAQPDFPFPPRYEGVYRDRRKVCGVQLYQSVGIEKDDRGAAAEQGLENFKLFGAPHLLLITTPEDLGIYGAIDCGLYISNFVLAAREHGVDTIAQAALARHPGLVREYFGLPVERKVVCGISFGYADSEHPINQYRTERAGLADVVDWRG